MRFPRLPVRPPYPVMDAKQVPRLPRGRFDQVERRTPADLLELGKGPKAKP